MTKRRSLLEVMEKSLESEVRTPQEEETNQGPVGESSTTSKRRARDAKRNKWVQMNVFVPEELRAAFKLQALKEQRDMSDIVTELLNSYLSARSETDN